jgi:hypothetical protein
MSGGSVEHVGKSSGFDCGELTADQGSIGGGGSMGTGRAPRLRVECAYPYMM